MIQLIALDSQTIPIALNPDRLSPVGFLWCEGHRLPDRHVRLGDNQVVCVPLLPDVTQSQVQVSFVDAFQSQVFVFGVRVEVEEVAAGAIVLGHGGQG